MMRRAPLGFVCGVSFSAVLIVSAALAQSGGGIQDLSAIAAQAAAAKASADVATAAANAAAAQISNLAVPQPCGTVPSADTLMGSIGSGNCFARPTDTRPTVTQAASVITDASGNWSVTWAKPFGSAAYYVNPQPGYATTPAQPFTCNYNTATQTTTFVQGKCWQNVSMTLPGLATSLLGLVLNPTAAAPSTTVRVVARDTTQ